jgi:cephalosporin hydroxylase
LRELESYSPLVKKGSYIVVFDTMIEDLPNKFWKNKPWGKGNNPSTAVDEFLSKNSRFDREDHPGISANPGGYLKCVSD